MHKGCVGGGAWEERCAGLDQCTGRATGSEVMHVRLGHERGEVRTGRRQPVDDVRVGVRMHTCSR